MDVQAYLRRIGLEAVPEPTVANLYLLQKAHLFHVPYENMDIVRGVPLSLEVEALYDKIVTRGRGGYCFELNRLFGWLLRALGYRVTDYFARFLDGDREHIPMRRHHVMKVLCADSDTPYVVDAGVGSGSPTYPMRMTAGEVQVQPDETWRYVVEPPLGWTLERLKNGQWTCVFAFTEEAQFPVDYVAASFYCEKSPDSIFNKAPMISLRNEEGRVTLDGDELRVFAKGTVAVQKTDDVERILAERFGIRL